MYNSIGQVPTNGGYSARRTGVFGQAPQVFVNPPTFDDGGLLRVTPGSLPAFEWSMNTTTNMDTNLGAQMTETSPGTYQLSVASGIGDYWLNVYKEAGYAILFQMNAELGSKLDFYVTTDPSFIADNAKADDNNIAVVGGNEAVIQAAKVVLSGGALPDLPPAQLPQADQGCPEGQIGIPPFCMSVPTLPPPPGGAPALPPPGEPFPGGVEPEPALPPAEPPSVTKAGVGASPGWIIAAVIGVGAVGAFAMYRMREVQSI